MKLIILTLCACFFSAVVLAQSPGNPKYDAALAAKLGGDDYGMKMYVLVILKTGTNTTTDKVVLDSLFKGHMANINRLASLEKLVIAGPLGNNEKNYRGIFILNVKTKEEANALLVTDPAIKAHVFDVELYPWYGSAAVGEYLQAHERIEKKKM